MSQTNAIQSRDKKIFTTKELVLTALMAVLIAVCSWISIPTVVPFTLQTFAVFCAVNLLGGKNGFFSILVYLLIGALGVPVFAEFSAGVGVLFGMTGGYILGFVFIAVIFRLAELIPARGNAVRIVRNVIAMVIGLAVMYAFGTAWFMHIYARDVESISLSAALKMCVTPFVLVDLAKMAAAIILTERLRKYVEK